jgi:hypothetical protein
MTTGETVPYRVVARKILSGVVDIILFILLVVMLFGAKLLGIEWGDPG